MEQIRDDDDLYRRLAPEHVNPDNPAHALIEGENNREKSRRLAEATALLIQPQPRQ